jgi:hypothetical protein
MLVGVISVVFLSAMECDSKLCKVFKSMHHTRIRERHEQVGLEPVLLRCWLKTI